MDINGKQARLATLSEDGEIEPRYTDKGTLAMAWKLRDGLAVKLFFSIDRYIWAGGSAELKKMAEGIRATK
ncbi:hypothetical protein ABZ297_00970 [Nonomuraea sp. NPDC005983]|uniref:hypothetical protein n=1 Tax=Nonomuraea sp. NPDC005983 TaxID=3155595 RepID=UPI0033B07430